MNEPARVVSADFYISAFYQLSADRYPGEIPGPIPWSTIVLFADRRKLDEEASLIFEHVIRNMDSAYISWYTEKVRIKKKLQNKG